MRFIILIIASLISVGTARAEVLELHYTGFTVWVDCDRRGPILFHYVAKRDRGKFPREAAYKRDHNVPDRCQSKRTNAFGSSHGVPYDVGHQVPANHLDGSRVSLRQANFWTNLLPQTASMNRGAWQKSEEIIECARDIVPLQVWGGAIWDNATNEFVASHGIKTPSAYWKVVIRTDNRQAMAWIIPNGKAPRDSLDRWLKSVAEVEAVAGRTFDAADKNVRPEHSWSLPSGCDLG